jgi:single-strand DNA-binding protein
MIGNLTRDIELKYLPSGAAIAKGAIATSHKYKTQSGEQKDEVCFLDFTVFGKGGEILNQYVRKGSKVMLEGRLVFEQWQAQDGTNRSRHTLSVSEFKFLDSKADSQSMNGGNNYQAPQQQSYNQPQQNSYQAAPQQMQQNYQQPYNNNTNSNGGFQHPAPENIPTIDIDNDEIPF